GPAPRRSPPGSGGWPVRDQVVDERPDGRNADGPSGVRARRPRVVPHGLVMEIVVAPKRRSGVIAVAARRASLKPVGPCCTREEMVSWMALSMTRTPIRMVAAASARLALIHQGWHGPRCGARAGGRRVGIVARAAAGMRLWASRSIDA